MLRIAKILKSIGTDGGILIGLYGCVLEEINLKEPVFVEFDSLPVPFFILDATAKGNGKAVVHLNDIKSLSDAEEIVGRDIFINAESESDEQDDFSGWKVYDCERFLGEVTGMEPIPGNLCIYVGEILLPLHEDFIVEADPENRVMRLDLPEGLY